MIRNIFSSNLTFEDHHFFSEGKKANLFHWKNTLSVRYNALMCHNCYSKQCHGDGTGCMYYFTFSSTSRQYCRVTLPSHSPTGGRLIFVTC